MSNLVKRAIQLQTVISKQLRQHGEVDTKLIDDLNNLHQTLNSYECELLMEWYNEQNINDQVDEFEKQEYTQLELGFNLK